MILPMIEEVEALQNLDSIAAVDGIDVAFVGPKDLFLRMGLPGLTSDPKVRAAADDAMRRLSRSALLVGVWRLITLGVQLIVTSVAGFIGTAARAYLADAPPFPLEVRIHAKATCCLRTLRV